MKKMFLILFASVLITSPLDIDAKIKKISKTKPKQNSSYTLKKSIKRGFGFGLGWQMAKETVKGVKKFSESETARKAWAKSRDAAKKGYEKIKEKTKK